MSELTLQELKEHCLKTLQMKEMMSAQIKGIKFQSDKGEQEHRMVLELIEEHENREEHDAKIRADAINECIVELGNNYWEIAKLEQLKNQKKQ